LCFALPDGAAPYPGFRHCESVNRGWHTIFTGGRYDSCLTLPLNLPPSPKPVEYPDYLAKRSRCGAESILFASPWIEF